MTRDQLIEMQKKAWPADYHKIVDKHGYDPKGMTKFYNHEFQWDQAANRLKYLDFPFAPPVLRCLDIGPAAGHFPFALKLMGHTVHTQEVPNLAPYTDSLDFLGIPTTKEFVLANTPLPKVPEMQDLDFISACGVCFDIMPKQVHPHWQYNQWGYLWGIPEWKFFFEDMLDRLNPGGRAYVRFNYSWPGTPALNQVWVLEQPEFIQWLKGNPRVKKTDIQSPDCQIWKVGG